MASTKNNFNSKRKLKDSSSSTHSSPHNHHNHHNHIIMDGNTSQFSDYLSNINNQTGMTEESLLLSPIFPNHHSHQTAEDGETSPYAIDSKLLASSNIKRRRSSVVKFQRQSDEMTTSMDMDMNNQSDILNSPQFVKSNRIMVTKSNTDVTAAAAVEEGDKSRQWNESWNDVKSVSFQWRNESREEGTKGTTITTTTTTPSWKRALDESACPSLGLGSIGTQSGSQSKNEEEEEYIMGKSLQLDEGISVNDDDDDDVDEHSIQNDIGQEEQGLSYVCCEDKDNCENEKQQSNLKDESGISFGSSLLNQSLDEESLQDSMQDEEQDENADNDSSSSSIDKSHCTQQEEAWDDMGNNTLMHSSDVMEQEEGCAEPTTNISPHVSTRVTMSPKEENNGSNVVESTLRDKDDVAVTPHLHSTDERAQDKEEFTSPCASIEKIRLGLTPRLKKLQSKLIRESLQGQHVDESNTELDVTSSTTPTTQKDKIRSSTDGDDSCNIVASELSLTPALKSFRSKLIRDSLSIGEFDDTSLYGLGSPYGHVNSIVGRTASMVQGKEDDKENVKPCNVPHDKETNRKKLLKSTDAPTCEETKNVHEMLSPNVLTNCVGTQPQFLSPSLRQSTTTFATSTSSKGRTSKRVVFEDDLYLDQPIDLSSAKKNLNAQSSALVERLRGAAQKRMMSITRTRDSLAKKETMQEQMTMNANKEELNVPENGTALDECDSTSNKIEFRRDKKVTEQVQRPTGVPSVQKRPATVPISPKLGLRRDATTKVLQTSQPLSKNQASSSIEKTTHDETTLYSRKTRSSTCNLTSAKRKPLTIPKSPLLGSRRKADQVNSTKPKASTNKLTHKSPIVTISKLADPISPMGLEFLSRSPTGTDDDDDNAKQNEQVAPFTLHTQLRAKERAKFEACRILNEKLRNEAISKDRERLLREKFKELESLKDKLS